MYFLAFLTGEVKPRKSLWLGKAANLLAIQLLAANLLVNICLQLRGKGTIVAVLLELKVGNTY